MPKLAEPPYGVTPKSEGAPPGTVPMMGTRFGLAPSLPDCPRKLYTGEKFWIEKFCPYESCSAPVATRSGLTAGLSGRLMTTRAVALSGPLTVSGPHSPGGAPPTDTPGPKFACVAPCRKLV